MLRLPSFAIFAFLALTGCDRFSQATAENKPSKPAAPAKTSAKSKSKPDAHATATETARYVVPFAWEASREEPLAQARSFLKEILTDNRVYMEHGPRFFAAFADGQKPRATVVTCADSRVHTPAFDTTPENDDFMIRNIGNQVANAEGSIEYGVEHLETPVLMVLGHTGCGAVQAALGDISGHSAPVRRELEKLTLPKPKPGASPGAVWTDAVIANVHNQVTTSLGHFGGRVREGKLTVIGAIYDFRNDLGNGPGKLTVVNVNGNSEPERMAAFLRAVEADLPADHPPKDTKARDKGHSSTPSRAPAPRAKEAPSTSRAAAGPRTDGQTDQAVVDALGQIPGLLVKGPEAPPTSRAH